MQKVDHNATGYQPIPREIVERMELIETQGRLVRTPRPEFMQLVSVAHHKV